MTSRLDAKALVLRREVLVLRCIARLLASQDAAARSRTLAWAVSRHTADPLLGERVAAAVLRQAKEEPTVTRMDYRQSALFADTLREALTSSGWRKIVLALTPAQLAELDKIITALPGRAPGATAESAATTAHICNERRVVILIEPRARSPKEKP